MNPPRTPASSPLARLPAGLALLSLLVAAPACKRGEDSVSPDDEAGASADGAGGDAAKADDPGKDGVAVVAEGSEQLEPDPAQLEAGVPYLRFDVDVGDSPARGPADAPVTIVMFSDFECPYCGEALDTVAALERDYPGKIRFVYKAMPLNRHPNAMQAALIGHSAQAQGKFWEWHDLVFSGRGIDEATMGRYMQEIGLDTKRVRAELDRLEYAAEVRADIRVSKRLKLRSTPVFFINGRMLPGARPRAIFQHMIEQELELADRLGDAGVAADELYDYTTQWGYTAIVYEGDRPRLDDDTVYPVPIGDAPTRGRADAPITIVAFSDFQCPFCAKGHETMEELRARYGDDVRFVFKHFPLPGHPLGALASRASFAAAEAGKFWEFHDAVFELGGRYGPTDLVEIGEELGISEAKMEAAMTGQDNDPTIDGDVELGIRLGITGTPAYFVNGRPIVGAVPLLEFRMLIAEEMERVEAARAEGVAPEDMYEHLSGAEG